MGTVRAGRNSGRSRPFIGDRRGAAAFEMVIVYVFVMFAVFLPLVDLGIAGFKFISAYQALRDMGQRTQYSPPVDVTDSGSISTWASSLPATVGGYAITPAVYCGDPGTVAPCASADPTVVKYFRFTTSFTLSPMVLGSIMCSTCTIQFSQRFQ